MVSLREIQRDFLNAVLFDERAALARHVIANGIDPERRVGIYRNNARESFSNVMSATFPVLERLAGRDWLRQIGREYQERYPSRHGNLHFVGQHLGAYLDRRFTGTRYDYFADVARLEWAYQEVLVAAEHAPLDVARLESVAHLDYDRLVFELAPAARLVASRWPLLAIWRVNRCDVATSGDATVIDLDDGPSHVLVLRRQDHVALSELAPDDFSFLSACARGMTLAESITAIDAPAALPAILARCIGNGSLVDFHVAPATPSATSSGDDR